MSQGLVGTKTVDSVDKLQDLLAKFDPKTVGSAEGSQDPLAKVAPNCGYFGRWAHKVSGLVRSIDLALPSPEGQMFCPQCEVRWKQNSRQGYEVLLLHCDRSVIKSEIESEFEPIGNGWLVSAPFPAHINDTKDNRFPFNGTKDTPFPHGFHNPENIKLQQRYFRDAATDTVNFVALTLVTK